MLSDLRYSRVAEVVEAAGLETLAFWPGGEDPRPLERTQKPDGSYVTAGDLASNEILVRGIHELFPDDAIISEELPLPSTLADVAFHWTVDPIDGTHPFMRGESGFSVLVARMENNHPIFGVTHLPIEKMIVVAERGRGVWAGGQRISFGEGSGVPEGSVSLWNFGEVDDPRVRRARLDPNRALLELARGTLVAVVDKIRTHGIWDIAPRIVTVQEMGGIVTDETGGPVRFLDGKIVSRYIVACRRDVHEEILRDFTSG